MKLVAPKQFKEAVAKLGSKSPVGSKLASAEWSRVPVALRERAFFSATIENVQFLQRTKDFLGDFLTGAREKITLPDGTETTALKTGRAKFVEDSRRFALEQGMGPLDPKDAGSIKDITSEQRLNLIFDTQTAAAYEFGGWKQGLDPDVLDEFPAQRFIREVEVKEPRAYHTPHEGTVRLKSDVDFWRALNQDFGVPWGPWGWGCGHGVEDVDRAEAERLGLLDPGQSVSAPEPAFNEKLKASVRNLDPELQAWLKENLGDSVMVQGDAAWWKGDRAAKALAVDPKPKRTGPAEFPTSPDDLKVVRPLGGSTGADLVQDRRGNQWVRKYGKTPEHLREEFAADQLYRAAGINVPEGRIYEVEGQRPVKLTRLIRGENLGEYLAKATPEQRAEIEQRIRSGFAADALLGNWDVAGLSMDNIIVDAAGTPWRIDNGGSLRFRAQGALKTGSQWGPKVAEWDSLRNAATNPQTAKLFAGLTPEQLAAQVADLQARRDAILAAAPGDVRRTLADRLDDLQARVKPALRIESEEFGREVAAARVLGTSHHGDAGLVEDQQVLFYTERRGGQDVTVARFKLTEPGGTAVREILGNTAPPTKVAADPYWSPILDAVKTVNTHAADGQYNQSKLAALKQLKADLAAKPGAQSSYYLGLIKEVEEAAAAKVPTRSGFSAWQPPAPKATEATPSGWSDVKRQKWDFDGKKRTRGRAETDGTKIYELDSAVGAAHRGGVKVRLVMPDDEAAPYALRGTVELVAPGKGGKAATSAIAQAARDLGVAIDDSTPAQRQIGYIARNLGAVQKTLTPAKQAEWRAIYDSQAADEQKAALLKDWVRRELNVDVENPQVFQPDGQSNSFGSGFRRWDRFDMPRRQVEKEMKAYTLHHQVTGGDIPGFIASILDGGGQVTPTTERLRIGVPLTSGMSTGTDLNTGGASYFFTRIKSERMAGRIPGITFKVGNLSRLDAYSYAGDKFGDVRPVGKNGAGIEPASYRALTPTEWKEYATHSSNETLFKSGFHLLDDVQNIRVNTAQQRDKIIKTFADHGYTALPDGRAIEDVVLVKR